MFLRNQWYCAALAQELGQAPLGRILLNEPVVLYRTGSGEIVALEDRCCHRRAPLSKGKIEGANLRCGYHGFLYDQTGQCIWVPGQAKVPPEARVRSYPVVNKSGYVWIWMGDPALADPDKAPDFFWNDHPEWAARSEYLHIGCDYLLMVDNLMDLSHVAFLHAKTIGSPEDTNPALDWKRGPRFVRGTRTANGLSPSARMKAEGLDVKIDQVKVMEFTPPANVVIDIHTTEAGKPEAESRINQRLIVLDTMTPETESTCHYFFGNCRDYYLDDRKLDELMIKRVVDAFLEDKDMLEGEQKIIDLAPAAPQIDVMGDTGGLQSRRLVQRLIEEEQSFRAAAAE